MREAATALALKPLDRLLLIELPIAKAVILGGIQIAAVLSVGTATIAAFVGAGGFGDRIAQGLALNNNELLLAGAIPAASLALLLQFLFEKLNKKRF
jgi:osmoprotectant transport system permease protein